MCVSHHFSCSSDANAEFLWLTTQELRKKNSCEKSLAALLCTRRQTRVFLFQFHITYRHCLQTATLIFHRIFLHIGPGTLKRVERLVATNTWPLFPYQQNGSNSAQKREVILPVCHQDLSQILKY